MIVMSPGSKLSEGSQLLNADMTDIICTQVQSHSLSGTWRKEKPLTIYLCSLLCQNLFGSDGCLNLDLSKRLKQVIRREDRRTKEIIPQIVTEPKD